MLCARGTTSVHNHWLFIQNVLAHLVASMSSIVSFGLAIYEAFKKKKIESRVFFIVGAFFLILACDQAWQDEHHNTQTLVGEKSAILNERDFWKDQSYGKDASLRSRDELLTKNYGVLAQTQSSLATLSNRLLDVAKPAPLKIDVMRWEFPATYTYANIGKVQFWVLVLIANKVISPTRGTITCDAPFGALTSTILTHGNTMRAGYEQTSPKTVHVEFMYPPWSAQNPLVFAVYTPEGNDINTCSFKLD